MDELLKVGISPLVQLGLWIAVGLVGILVGPGFWRTYRAHVDQLQEQIDDLDENVARLRAERDAARDEVIALQTEINYHRYRTRSE